MPRRRVCWRVGLQSHRRVAIIHLTPPLISTKSQPTSAMPRLGSASSADSLPLQPSIAPMTLSWNSTSPPRASTERPFATVALEEPKGLRSSWHRYALVDSGSAATLFPRSFLHPQTKLNFTASHPNVGTIIWRGVAVQIWYHEMHVMLANQFHADGSPVQLISGRGRIGFWQDRDKHGKAIESLPYPLLGQRGLLEFLVFTEYAGQKVFELRPDSSVHRPWRES